MNIIHSPTRELYTSNPQTVCIGSNTYCISFYDVFQAFLLAPIKKASLKTREASQSVIDVTKVINDDA